MMINDSASGEDEPEVDEFTKKRLPKAHDFLIR